MEGDAYKMAALDRRCAAGRDAFYLCDTDGTVYMLARPGVEPPDHPLFQALKGMYEGGSQNIAKRRCSSCGEEGEGAFCTECGNRLI